jgi:hypothetical protein
VTVEGRQVHIGGSVVYVHVSVESVKRYRKNAGGTHIRVRVRGPKDGMDDQGRKAELQTEFN